MTPKQAHIALRNLIDAHHELPAVIDEEVKVVVVLGHKQSFAATLRSSKTVYDTKDQPSIVVTIDATADSVKVAQQG